MHDLRPISPLPFPVFDGFTASQSLSLSTDGPIDPRLSSLAFAFDRAAAKRAPRHGRIGKVTLKPNAIVRIMTTVIEKAVVRCGAVHRNDFLQVGLKDAEIDRHFQEAFLKVSQHHPSLFQSEAA